MTYISCFSDFDFYFYYYFMENCHTWIIISMWQNDLHTNTSRSVWPILYGLMIKMLQYKMYPAGELRCPTTALVLISTYKHMLWVLTRSAFNEYPQHMFSWRNKKNISTYGLTYLRLINHFFFTFNDPNRQLWISFLYNLPINIKYEKNMFLKTEFSD